MIPLNLYIPKAIPDHLPYRLALLTNPGVLTSVRRLFAKTESIGEMAMFQQLSSRRRHIEQRLCVFDVVVAAIIPWEKPFLVWPETLHQRKRIVFVKPQSVADVV
jgi:hypothetical protein